MKIKESIMLRIEKDTEDLQWSEYIKNCMGVN